jgi:hypothetical protein
MALTALSPPPPATTTEAFSPQRAATCGSRVAETSQPSTSVGIWLRDRPHLSSRASDQSRFATSSHSVPAASDISETFFPVIR